MNANMKPKLAANAGHFLQGHHFTTEAKTFWGTLSYLEQLKGGGESYDGQPSDLHLIEKTEREVVLTIGYNF